MWHSMWPFRVNTYFGGKSQIFFFFVAALSTRLFAHHELAKREIDPFHCIGTVYTTLVIIITIIRLTVKEFFISETISIHHAPIIWLCRPTNHNNFTYESCICKYKRFRGKVTKYYVVLHYRTNNRNVVKLNVFTARVISNK